MIRIALVDNEPDMLSIAFHYVNQICESNKEIQVSQFLSAEDVIRKLEAGERFDIIVSDIEMPEMDGLSFGEMIKKKYLGINLVFLTAYADFAAKSYRINADQYILKEEMAERIPEILEQLIQKVRAERKSYIKIGNQFDVNIIMHKDIIYIQKLKAEKYVLYKTKQGEFRERTTLEKVLEDLESDKFLLAERGYIVNIQHILRVKGNLIYLDNGETVVISRKRMLEVNEKIHEFWGNAID